ncbi:MAG: hypothetical protein ABL955_09010 [Elusimicrobiota bacterium]
MSLVFMTALLCPPARAQARLEIVDVDHSRRAALAIQPVCGVDPKTEGGDKFVERLWKRYASVFGLKDWRSFGPDSAYRRITLVWQEKKIILESWHPIVERGGKGVAMSYGVTALDGRSLAAALKNDDAQYVKRREAFDAIVRECAARKRAR